ncbi:MAG: helix-turn-helix domain-containing protein [Acidobacteriota bacterium]|nr:helix-turn-helix domain-containing protein [Acidobacteriota bacterium]
MKHVSVLVPESALLAAIDDPRHVFSAVNRFYENEGKPPIFDIKLVGLKREVNLHNSSFTVHTDLLLSEVKKTDLIFIPAFEGILEDYLEKNKDFIPWIKEHHRKGAEVVSLCIGAFLLARTGLLKGKQCSTHWRAAEQFRRMFPDVNLVTDKIITEEQGIYTSGGATSYWNLLLYLVEKYTNRETAILAAKYFAIDIERHSQSQFIMFTGQSEHADEEIKKAQEFIENNFQKRITIDDLSTKFALSRRSLERRFKRATNNTVSEYIQRVKIEAAKKRLETSRKNITEVMFDVGYSDTKAFRGIFKKITGMTPFDYRNKYNKEA